MPRPHKLGGRAVVVAIANQKGGVGKTTSVVMLARILARQFGLRVLVVDLDHQAHATLYLLGIRRTMALESDIGSVIVRGEPVDQVITSTPFGRVDLLPASAHLAVLDIQLVSMTRREYKIQEAMQPVADDYDVILLDCPPSLSLVVTGGLVAADHLVTPLDPGQFAMLALSRFLDQVEALRSPDLVTAIHLGALVTRVDARTKGWRDIVRAVGARWPLFDAIIPSRVGWEEAVAQRAGAAPVDAEQDPAADMTQAYQRAAAELLDRLAELGEEVGAAARIEGGVGHG